MVLLTQWPELGRLVADSFCSLPVGLRPYALELESLVQRQKPACLFAVDRDDANACVRYLLQQGLACVVAPHPTTVHSYAQTSPPNRMQLIARKRMRLYVASKLVVAQQVAELELRAHDSVALGEALGYPACCIAAAAERDRIMWDEAAANWRQTNLNAAALRISTKLEPHCNRFLMDANIEWVAPMAAIAHYPCSFDCLASSAIGRVALQFAAWKWPLWAVVLGELLRSPIIYWSDDGWPAEYWDETCGIALPAATARGSDTWTSPVPGFTLGSARTPSGPLPVGVLSMSLTGIGVMFVDIRGKSANLEGGA